MRYILSIFILVALLGPSLGRAEEFTGTGVFEDIRAQSNAAGEGTGLVAGKNENAISYYIAPLIQRFLGLLGIIAIILIIYAGFLWMTAGGEEEKVTKAKSLLGNAAIGLAIIFTAYAITRFVFYIVVPK